MDCGLFMGDIEPHRATRSVKWRRIGIAMVCFCAVASVWIALPPACLHASSMQVDSEYLPKLARHELRNELLVVWELCDSGKIFRRPMSELRSLFETATWTQLTADGCRYTFWLPSTDEGLILVVDIDVDWQCNHVVFARFGVRSWG